MAVKFANNAESTLASGITSGATTLTVAAGEGNNFPIVAGGSGDYFYCTLVDVSGNREIIKVTTHTSGDVFQVIERGADDTSGTAYSTSDKIQLRLPKIVLEAFRDDIATNAADIVTNAADIATNVADIATNTADIAANALLLLAPSGLKMYFYENVAPTGWTLDAGPADSLLAIKGGAQDYNDTGGQVLGSWTPTTHTHTGPSHTHTGPSHTHTGPSHTHTMGTHNHMWYNFIGSSSNDQSFASNGSGQAITGTNNTGYDKISVHDGTIGGSSVKKMDQDAYTNNVDPGNTNAGGTGATGASGTGATSASGTAATGSSSAPSTDRPQAAVGIIATKD